MLDFGPALRPARPADAAALADLIVFASDGLCLDVWAAMAGPGETPLEVGRRRAARDEGAFSWRNAVVADQGAGAAATLVGYPLPATAQPIPADLPPGFAPLAELEAAAAGTWYVNVLAAYPEQRGQGHGSRLLAAAERLRARAGAPAVSLIASDANRDALRLYLRRGFRVVASRPAVASDRTPAQAAWLLLVREA